MIRKSGKVAAIALVLSLIVHLLIGIGFTWPVQPTPQPSGGETSTEIVAPGTAFEDLADTVDEPETTPEPPVEAEEIQDAVDLPTSQALIASETPQEDITPDTNTTPGVEPESTGPSPLQAGDTPEPETVDPVSPDNSQVTDPILTPPAGTDTVTDIPLGAPDAPIEPSEISPQAPGVQSPTTVPAITTPTPPVAVAPASPPQPAVSQQPLETVPEPTENSVEAGPETPIPPVAVAPVTPSLPLVSQQPSAVAPETVENTVEASPDTPTPPVTVAPVAPTPPVESQQPSEVEPETIVEVTPEAPIEPVETEGSETAVTTSLRPRLPTKRPTPPPEGLSDGSSQTTTARRAPAPRIESPLTAFKRDGTNTIGRRSGGTRSGGQGLRNTFSGGNAGVTNYAGRVLAQLNRTSPVNVTGSGWARVRFQINPDGTLASVVVIDSSGSRSIDRAAQRQVRSAGRFPKPPGGKSRRLNFFYRIR